MAITLTDLTNNRVYATAGANASLTLSGTYSGSPTAIEARIMDGVGVAVDWTTIDSSPSGGAFSGDITVPNGGPYTAEVRFSNDTGDTDEGTSEWFVGYVVIVAGQSNVSEWFADSGAPTADDQVRIYDGSWSSGTSDDDGAISFGNKLQSLTSTPVGVVNGASSGSGLLEKYTAVTNRNWLSNDYQRDDWYTDASGFDGVLTAIDDTANAVIWGQGEADSHLNTNEQLETEYFTGLSALIEYFRADLSNSDLPIVVLYLGQRLSSSSELGMQRVRNAQIRAVENDANTYGVALNDQALADAVHISDYSVAGERAAQAFAYHLGDVSYYEGPRITGVEVVNTTTVDVTLTHENGTDFSPATGITGFEVLEHGSSLTISSASRQDAVTVRLSLSTAITDTNRVVVRYQYGDEWSLTGDIKDNDTLALPIVPLISASIVPGGSAMSDFFSISELAIGEGVSGEAGGTPTLSDPTHLNVTETTAQIHCDVTFPA